MSKELLQAKQEIPPAFYEELFVHHSIVILTAIAVSAGYFANNQSFVSVNVKDEKDALIRIASVAALTIGSIMDTVSSVKVADLTEQSQKLGMEPLLPGVV